MHAPCKALCYSNVAEKKMRNASTGVDTVQSVCCTVQGMYDAKDGPLSSERWMKTMHAWRDLPGFLQAPRHVWRTKAEHQGQGAREARGEGEGRSAGYTRSWGPLTHIVLIGAGHQVPADQPQNALEMIETWVEAQMACHGQAAAARL